MTERGRGVLVLVILVGMAALAVRAGWPRSELGAPREAVRCLIPVERAGWGVECLSKAEAARLGVEAGDRIGGDGARGRMAATRLAALEVVLDLNRAAAGELESLPGVGPGLAASLVAARPFATVDAIGDVPGIGPKRKRAIAPRLKIEGCENCIGHGAGR